MPFIESNHSCYPMFLTLRVRVGKRRNGREVPRASRVSSAHQRAPSGFHFPPSSSILSLHSPLTHNVASIDHHSSQLHASCTLFRYRRRLSQRCQGRGHRQWPAHFRRYFLGQGREQVREQAWCCSRFEELCLQGSGTPMSTRFSTPS
jgi:hypothetical protein